MVELVWCWLRYQPQSHLAQWYRRRFAEKAGRSRKVGVIALVRKLAIALWRFLEQGSVPEGAKLKTSDHLAADGQLKGGTVTVRRDGELLANW